MKKVTALVLAALFALTFTAAFAHYDCYYNPYYYQGGCYAYGPGYGPYYYDPYYSYPYPYYYDGYYAPYYYCMPLVASGAYDGNNSAIPVTQSYYGNVLTLTVGNTPIADTGSAGVIFTLNVMNAAKFAGSGRIAIAADGITAEFDVADLYADAINAGTNIIAVQISDVSNSSSDGVKALDRHDTDSPVYAVDMYNKKGSSVRIGSNALTQVSIRCNTADEGYLAYYSNGRIYYPKQCNKSSDILTGTVSFGVPFTSITDK